MSLEKVRAAMAATQDTYVRSTAGEIAAACAEIGPTATLPGTLGAHALTTCEKGKDGPDTGMLFHRVNHGKIFTQGS